MCVFKTQRSWVCYGSQLGRVCNMCVCKKELTRVEERERVCVCGPTEREKERKEWGLRGNGKELLKRK